MSQVFYNWYNYYLQHGFPVAAAAAAGGAGAWAVHNSASAMPYPDCDPEPVFQGLSAGHRVCQSRPDCKRACTALHMTSRTRREHTCPNARCISLAFCNVHSAHVFVTLNAWTERTEPFPLSCFANLAPSLFWCSPCSVVT